VTDMVRHCKVPWAGRRKKHVGVSEQTGLFFYSVYTQYVRENTVAIVSRSANQCGHLFRVGIQVFHWSHFAYN